MFPTKYFYIRKVDDSDIKAFYHACPLDIIQYQTILSWTRLKGQRRQLHLFCFLSENFLFIPEP